MDFSMYMKYLSILLARLIREDSPRIVSASTSNAYMYYLYLDIIFSYNLKRCNFF